MMSAFVHGGACPPHIAIRSWEGGNGAGAVFDQYIGHRAFPVPFIVTKRRRKQNESKYI